MTTPFEPPDDTSGPIQPPPPPPDLPTPYADAPQPHGRYDTKAVLWTTVIVVVVVALATWVVPYVGLLVPLVLLVAVFFLLKRNPTVRYRSVLAGVLLGLGLGLLVTAGICTAIFSGSLYTPLFS